MDTSDTLSADSIKSIGTRFYYENGKLNYEIVITYNDDTIATRHFDDPDKYTRHYKAIAELLNNEKSFTNKLSYQKGLIIFQ